MNSSPPSLQLPQFAVEAVTLHATTREKENCCKEAERLLLAMRESNKMMLLLSCLRLLLCSTHHTIYEPCIVIMGKLYHLWSGNCQEGEAIHPC